MMPLSRKRWFPGVLSSQIARFCCGRRGYDPTDGLSKDLFSQIATATNEIGDTVSVRATGDVLLDDRALSYGEC